MKGERNGLFIYVLKGILALRSLTCEFSERVFVFLFKHVERGVIWIRATTGALGTHSQVIISAFLTSYYFFVDSTFTNYKISANRFSVEILFLHTVILVNWLVCRAKYFTVLIPEYWFSMRFGTLCRPTVLVLLFYFFLFFIFYCLGWIIPYNLFIK